MFSEVFDLLLLALVSEAAPTFDQKANGVCPCALANSGYSQSFNFAGASVDWKHQFSHENGKFRYYVDYAGLIGGESKCSSINVHVGGQSKCLYDSGSNVYNSYFECPQEAHVEHQGQACAPASYLVEYCFSSTVTHTLTVTPTQSCVPTACGTAAPMSFPTNFFSAFPASLSFSVPSYTWNNYVVASATGATFELGNTISASWGLPGLSWGWSFGQSGSAGASATGSASPSTGFVSCTSCSTSTGYFSTAREVSTELDTVTCTETQCQTSAAPSSSSTAAETSTVPTANTAIASPAPSTAPASSSAAPSAPASSAPASSAPAPSAPASSEAPSSAPASSTVASISEQPSSEASAISTFSGAGSRLTMGSGLFISFAGFVLCLLG